MKVSVVSSFKTHCDNAAGSKTLWQSRHIQDFDINKHNEEYVKKSLMITVAFSLGVLFLYVLKNNTPKALTVLA